MRWLALALTAVALASWITQLRDISLDGAESSVDAYYHVRLADLGPAAWTAKQFPQTTMSVWAENFCDKELLFHAALFMIRSTQLYCGGNMEPPFHVPSFCIVFAVLLAFMAAGRRMRVPWMPLAALLLVVAAPSFTWRLSMVRPHNMAIVLALGCFAVLAGIDKPRQLWRVALLGFVGAWAYSPPFFLVLPVCAFMVVGLRRHPLLSLQLPLAAGAGMALGYLIHPQFPNTFIMLKVACIDIAGSLVAGTPTDGIGNELMAPTAGWLMKNSAVLLIAALNVLLFAALTRARHGKLPERNSCALFLVGAVTAGGMMLSRRLIEYACPFNILAMALLLRDLHVEYPWPRKRIRAVGIAALVALLVAAGAVTRGFATAHPGTFRPMYGFAAWAHQRLPIRTPVANLNWSDFPMLFYAAPHYRYLVGLDPAYAYHEHPKRFAKLEAFRQGELKMPPAELAALVDARYAAVSLLAWELAKDMHADGFTIVYQGNDGWVFDLLPEQR